MLTRLITTSALTGALALTIGSQAFAQTELSWWHGMTGANNEMVNELSKEFNESQSEYKIVPVYKGSYPETLNAGIAAFRSKQPPAIIQVFDAGSGVMMAAEGAVVPAAEVLEKGGFKFDKSQYLPGIVAYYSKPDGTMLSFPYNSSSPILYYNKDAFKKAGLDENNPPKTWPEVFEAAKRSSQAAHLPVALLRPGSHGFRLRTSLPGTMFPTAPMKTASAAPMLNSKSTNRFSLSTSRQLLISPRMAPSVTAAVRLKQNSFSLPANARC